MMQRYIPRDGLISLITVATKGYELYGHETLEGQDPHMVRTTPEQIVLGTFRSVEPIKAYLYPPRENMGNYFAEENAPSFPPIALVGVTACDLRSLRVQDKVFLGGDYKDPYYEERRKALFVISMDCTKPCETCFCTFFGQPPVPSEKFDLNLSPLAFGKDGYVVEAGSGKAEELLESLKLPEPSIEQLAVRDEQRFKSTKIVENQVEKFGMTKAQDVTWKIKSTYGLPFWKKWSDMCVECGACNFICPACHCFFLFDSEQRGKFRRFKNWDSCLLLKFARVAGDHNPRKYRVERLQNRFEKKFEFLINVIEDYGCTGCGRCTPACAGHIPIENVLSDIIRS